MQSLDRKKKMKYIKEKQQFKPRTQSNASFRHLYAN